MRIFFLTRLYVPHIGGVERHVQEISRCLQDEKYEVSILTEQFDKTLPLYEKDETKIYRIPVGKSEFFKKFVIWFWLLKHKNLLSNADIIHCHDVFFWYLPFRFFFPRKKVFTTFHGYEGVYPPTQKAKIVRKISENLSFGNICVGKFIEKWYGTKANFVTYGGIKKDHRPEVKNQKSGSKLKITFVGRIVEDTGVRVYTQILQELTEQRVEFDFNAFGRGDLEGEFKKFGDVGFTGDVEPEIRKADIIFASSYLSILEALVNKKMVVSVYSNPLKMDYLLMSPMKDYILIGDQPQKLVQQIQKLQEDPHHYEAFIEQGYQWAQKRTWEHVAQLYIKLWNQ